MIDKPVHVAMPCDMVSGALVGPEPTGVVGDLIVLEQDPIDNQGGLSGRTGLDDKRQILTLEFRAHRLPRFGHVGIREHGIEENRLWQFSNPRHLLSRFVRELDRSNNSVTALVTVTYLEPNIVAGGATLLAQGMAPPNGAINANEIVTVSFTLDNIGTAPTTNLTATLQNSGGVTPTTTTQVYGAIPAGGSAAEPFTFIAQGAPGATVTATLVLVDVSNSLGSVTFSFMIPVTTNYASTNGIIIPQQGAGTPYPSQILVSGLTNGGRIF